MHHNRIELTRGRVTSIRTVSSDGEALETFEAGNEPSHFFVDCVSDNQRRDVWHGGDYGKALEVAELTASKTKLEIINLAGFRNV